MRYLGWAVEACVLAFAALIGCAMSLYPGGTFWDHARKGHSFWQNFLCDLVQNPAIGGGKNELGARLATAGMLSLVVAMVAFVGVVPSVIADPRRIAPHVRFIVAGACALVASVPLLPSDRFGALHAAAVFASGIPVTLAFIGLVVLLVRQPLLATWLKVLSLLLGILVSASLALYAADVFLHAPVLRIVPVLSRIANLGLVVWLIALSRSARSRIAS